MRWICRAIFIYVFRGRAFGRDHVPAEGGVLLVANHQSFLDPPLVGLPLNRECHFMARDTLFTNPHFDRLIRALNAFPVRRGASDVGALKEGLRRLKGGAALLVFPEGTRTRDGSVGPFLKGSLVLAQRTGVPIVPVAVHGAYECWPRNRRWPQRLPITIVYGKPVSAEEVARLSADELLERLRTMVGAQLEEAARRRRGEV